METSQYIAAAQAARSRKDWKTAALAYTDAADSLPSDPHGLAGGQELSLRREAHLCLCFTPEFLKYRTRQQSGAIKPDTREEWAKPSGALVFKLLRRSAPVIEQAEAACAAH